MTVRAEAAVPSVALLAGTVVLAATVRGHKIRQELITRAPRADGTVRVRRERMTVHLAGDKARLGREDGTVTIVRLRPGEIVEIDDLLKSYERKSFKRLRRQWAALNALLLEQIEGTPLGHPRRAELIDQLTDGREKWGEIWKLPEGEGRARLIRKYGLPEKPPKIEVRAAKEIGEIAGRDCRLYEALEDGRVTDLAYLALRIPFDRRYYEFMELAGWIGPELAKGLRRARGLPLRTLMRVRGGGEIELRTESVTRGEFKVSLFEIPDGYKERRPKASFR